MENGHFAKEIGRENGLFWAELENAKENGTKRSTKSLHVLYARNCAKQQLVLKNCQVSQSCEEYKFLRGVKNGHLAKVIGRRNGLFCAELKKCKQYKRRSTNIFRAVCRKRHEKTADI